GADPSSARSVPDMSTPSAILCARRKWIGEPRSFLERTTLPLFARRQRKSKTGHGRSTKLRGSVPKTNGPSAFAETVSFNTWFARSPGHYCRSAVAGFTLNASLKSLRPRTADLRVLLFQHMACTLLK